MSPAKLGNLFPFNCVHHHHAANALFALRSRSASRRPWPACPNRSGEGQRADEGVVHDLERQARKGWHRRPTARCYGFPSRRRGQTHRPARPAAKADSRSRRSGGLHALVLERRPAITGMKVDRQRPCGSGRAGFRHGSLLQVASIAASSDPRRFPPGSCATRRPGLELADRLTPRTHQIFALMGHSSMVTGR